mmetsp:Transcript_9083/g.20197  ORF Transcript_9083/g.20197 Transcript_9083/m.20197 type:complete len:396 (-) Transcript_9083:48-1235(-)
MSKDTNKAVVRLLPPEITEEELYQSIGEEHLKHAIWRSFLAGKRSKGDKPTRNSRCYLQFETVEAMEFFIKDYHGHQFVDDKGEPFRAVACTAPCQKIPKQKAQKDAREGTIEDDPMYKAFIEKLAQPKGQPDLPPNPKEDRAADPGDTPLVAFMKKQAKEKQARAEKARKKWEAYEEKGSKRSEWYCSECYTTNAKKLEEDPDNRGTFYCKRCWESWESHAPAKSKKKKSHKDKEYEYEDYQESSSKRHKHKKASDTKGEWRVKETSSRSKHSASAAAEDDEGDGRSKRKKKKDKYDKYDESQDSYGGSSRRWKPKWEAVQDDEEKDKRHRKSSSKEKDDWWREDTSSSRVWRTKQDEWGTEHGKKDDKSRRSRHKKEDEYEDSSYWKSKSRHK